MEDGPARGGPWDPGHLRDPHSPLTLEASSSSTWSPSKNSVEGSHCSHFPQHLGTLPARAEAIRPAGAWGQSPVPQGRTGNRDSASGWLERVIRTGLAGRFGQGRISKPCRPRPQTISLPETALALQLGARLLFPEHLTTPASRHTLKDRGPWPRRPIATRLADPDPAGAVLPRRAGAVGRAVSVYLPLDTIRH